MNNILVTGSNGQLGRELQKLSASHKGHTFFFTDVDTLDITDPVALRSFFGSNKIDVVINCAAYTAVDRAETDIANAIKINRDAVRNLVTEASNCNCKFVHLSTDYVFDGTACQPYSEDHLVNPQSVYGQTKLDGEKEALSYSNAIVIRTSWLYSSYGNNFVKTMIRLSKERNELKVVFDQIGSPTYAEDLAEVILKIINFTENEEFPKGIYHFSNEGVCSWFDFAWEILHYFNYPCKVIPIESAEYPTITQRPFYSVLNKNKIKAVFNLDIPYWKTSLYKCLSLFNN